MNKKLNKWWFWPLAPFMLVAAVILIVIGAILWIAHLLMLLFFWVCGTGPDWSELKWWEG